MANLANETADDIVDVNERHGGRRITYDDRHVTGDVMAPGGHCAVVVWTTPFPKDICQPVDEHIRTLLFAIGPYGRFRSRLTLPIVVVKCSLDAGTQENWRRVRPRRQPFQNVFGEDRVACLEFGDILWTIHTRKMHHEIARRNIGIEFLLVAEVVLEHLDVGPLFKRKAKIAPHKSFCASDKDLHTNSPHTRRFI